MNQDPRHPNEATPPAADPGTYTPPRLIRYGTVSEMTAAGSGCPGNSGGQGQGCGNGSGGGGGGKGNGNGGGNGKGPRQSVNWRGGDSWF